MSTVNPYINTKLCTLVPLKADQMNNKIYINLKQNLENNLLGRCYKNYGIVTEIFKIEQYKNGRIEAENFSASAVFEVDFSCRLCSPIVNKDIICEVLVISKMFITVKNGPIILIIANKDINEKVFKVDMKYNYLYRNETGIKVLQKDDHVKVRIVKLSFNNGDKEIIGMANLMDMATDEEITNYYDDIHRKDDEAISIDEHKKV